MNYLSTRETGLSIRSAMIKYLTSSTFLNQLESIYKPNSLALHSNFPPNIQLSSVNQDLRNDTHWNEEFWSIEPDGSVHHHTEEYFRKLPDSKKFSNSDSLRLPDKEAFALRGLLSAIRSEEVSTAFSDTLNTEDIRFIGSDIARYRPGHYLRRHDDLFDGRMFALVMFLHEEWNEEYGTELIGESPDGSATVIKPTPYSFALMRLAGGNYHLVTKNKSKDWTRLSIATHFGVKVNAK